MEVLITGSKGTLGSYLTEFLKEKGIKVVTADRPDYNITSYVSFNKMFQFKHDFKYLINCAAYTNVDQAENEKIAAYFNNAQALGVLSKVCNEQKIHLIQFSTDFVFDGKKRTPYLETDPPNPINFYGYTKLESEKILQKNMYPQNFSIFRIQWLYGNNNKNFFGKLMENKTGEFKIVADELGSPCSVGFVSDLIYKYLVSPKDKGGTFHLTHPDSCSRYDCGKYFLEKMNLSQKIEPLHNYPTKTARPKYGNLDVTKLSKYLEQNLQSWQEDLDTYIAKGCKC